MTFSCGEEDLTFRMFRGLYMTNIYINMYAYTYIHDSTLGLGCPFRDRKSIPDRRLRFTLGLKLSNFEGAVNGWFTWFCVYGFITRDGSMGRTAKNMPT